MEIKVYVIDFELPRLAKKALLLVPAMSILGTSALGHASSDRTRARGA